MSYRFTAINSYWAFMKESGSEHLCTDSTALVPIYQNTRPYTQESVQLSQYSEWSTEWRVRDSNPGREKYFSLLQNVPIGCGTPPASSGYQGSFPRLRLLGREVGDSSAPSAEAKNEWSYTSRLPVCLPGVRRDNLTSLRPHPLESWSSGPSRLFIPSWQSRSRTMQPSNVRVIMRNDWLIKDFGGRGYRDPS
jgi:hypothetical protein